MTFGQKICPNDILDKSKDGSGLLSVSMKFWQKIWPNDILGKFEIGSDECLRNFWCPSESDNFLPGIAFRCEEGTFHPFTDANSADDCMPCPVGKICLPGLDPEPCPKGFSCLGGPGVHPCIVGNFYDIIRFSSLLLI
ncbi:hypothetical protein DPMN_114380 [Dreissena polymorpha]|uniref:Uncharacterized protein n=1 Tax=Dreissena polymorpha TaxID=45954 RepID=A0A9D4KJA6_DREPO|nr:hypothetical protein DPMN_114380 [Dreissena polymorpha]